MNNKDFRKFATSTKLSNGQYVSGMLIDDYMSKMNNNPTVQQMMQMPVNGYQPTTVVEPFSTGNGVCIDIYSRLSRDRLLIIGTEIDDDVSNCIMSQLLFLNNENCDKNIEIYLNSEGGSVISGLQIVDTMMAIDAPVNTTCVGMAASMASVLLSIGERRLINPNSYVMIHPVSSGCSGKIADIKTSYELSNQLNETLFNILATHTGHTVDEVKSICKESDHWMNAQESVDFNICDAIIKPKKNIIHPFQKENESDE